MVSHLLFTLGGRFYPHFTDGEAKGQRGDITCPGPSSWRMAEVELESVSFCLQSPRSILLSSVAKEDVSSLGLPLPTGILFTSAHLSMLALPVPKLKIVSGLSSSLSFGKLLKFF